MLEALDAVERLASTRRDELRVPHVAGHDTTMLVLDGLAVTHPQLAVAELALHDREQLTAVADGRTDVGVCRLSNQPRVEVRCEACGWLPAREPKPEHLNARASAHFLASKAP
ncbi:MAG TPA: hypothetical protein VFW09_13810 [Solirubrobacteraceae bacterium]|nr:hypothetical protein [Solirubrobacteraceae bacterium]